MSAVHAGSTAPASTGPFVAVDLGASSGRVVLGALRPGWDGPTVELTETHRFANRPVRLPDGLHWDLLGLYREILSGLTLLGHGGLQPTSIGVDSWAVDYSLLDDDGSLLGLPFHYRDARGSTGLVELERRTPAAELYRRTGVPAQGINTLAQLMTERGTPRLTAAASLLMIPDLVAYWLTGHRVAEVTNASTTQLLDVYTRDWDRELADRLGLPVRMLPPICQPGAMVGSLRAEVADATGLTATELAAVGTHDTASAVVGVPASRDDFAYISSGTWSLVGLELDRPVVSEAGRLAGFTNEAGIGGTVRYLRNVMGLWLLQESMRSWGGASGAPDLQDLLRRAAELPALAAVIDVDAPELLAPGDMPARIAAACRESRQPVPGDPAATVRVILDSLGLAYRRTLRRAEALTGRRVGIVHVVGGGARNGLLCQLTADATGLPVLAGPVEATAIGNILVQALAAGPLTDLAAMRAVARRTTRPRRYLPRASHSEWDEADERATEHGMAGGG